MTAFARSSSIAERDRSCIMSEHVMTSETIELDLDAAAFVVPQMNILIIWANTWGIS